MMSNKTIWWKTGFYGLLALLLMGTALFWIGRKNLQTHPYEEAYLQTDPQSVLLLDENTGKLKQSFTNHADWISGFYLRFTLNSSQMTQGEVKIALKESDGTVLAEAALPAAEIQDNAETFIPFDSPVETIRDHSYDLVISSSAAAEDGSRPAIWYTPTVEGCALKIGDADSDNMLCFRPYSARNAQFYLRFSAAMLILVCILLFVLIKGQRDERAGKVTPTTEMIHIFDKYSFLLKQLVGRDFAIKYRRSYLGWLWVILNPLLTMIVMSSVFSYIFRLQIKNYAVYLILGNIVFNCFSEATQLSALSIVYSGQMIKKVYIPKYIFPLSKTMFSFFNFLITLIPAMLVILYYRIPITVNYLLLPFVLIGLFLFALGIGMFLSALQVFMRDTQYLYGILVTLWIYLTPIFYAEESLAPILRRIMQFNPMYVYINCIRKIMLYGITPTVFQLLACMLMGIVALTIGMRYFMKKQKLFILHI